MRQDLLKLIQDQDDVTNVVILSHNIDFVFIQSMVLRALRRCGNPKLTIFVDFQCAMQSFAEQAEVLDSLGIRYRVVPVTLEPSYRFHPKAVFLSGPKKATLFVGSGNVTYGGWRENGEVWVHYDSEEDGAGPFLAFREYVLKIIKLVPQNRSVRTELEEAFDSTTHRWVVAKEEFANLLGRVAGEKPLTEQISDRLAGKQIDLLTVCTPYYDDHAKALKELIELFKASRVHVLCQPGHCGLRKSAVAPIKRRITLRSIEVVRSERDEEHRSRFIHAKFYAFDRGNEVTVVAGSANCSRAALTASGRLGNAELVAIHTMSRKDFRERFFDELEFLATEPTLLEAVDDPDETPFDQAPLRLQAAHFDAGILWLAYHRRPEITITDCICDEKSRPVQDLGDGSAKVVADQAPRNVMLRGQLAREVICSNLIWVHNERELRSTGTARTLGDAIGKNIRPESWGLPAYAEILRALNKHLEYVPPRYAFDGSKNAETSSDDIEFTESDVFSGKYGLPGLGSSQVLAPKDEPISSLRKMLLRWFGRHLEETEGELETDSDDPTEADTLEEESVDQLNPLPKVAVPNESSKESESDRRGAQKLIKKITEAMAARSYLEFREPELLATDLKVTSVLLRIGLMEKWISKEDFFMCTHHIWTCWFFSSEVCATEGWLEYRYHTDSSPQTFVASMKSVELSAALAAWALAMADDICTPEEARFALSCVLSVARLPWVWRGGTTKAIAAELTAVLRQTTAGRTPSKTFWEGIEHRWLKMMRWGSALRSLEFGLRGHTPANLWVQFPKMKSQLGSFLWQGTSGFCVALESC